MLLDEIGRHLMRHIDDLAPADLAALVGGYAALDHSPGIVLFDSLRERCKALRGQFSEAERGKVAEGYRLLGYRPPQL